jgi:hypothetical protein
MIQDMATTRSRPLARPLASVAAIDALVATIGVLILAKMTLLTPAFTDYEQESEPAIQAIIHGHFAQGFKTLPIYGGSILALTPAAGLAKLFGGGDLAIYRAVAVPGAIGVVLLATVAARWLREVGRSRRDQLLVVALLALSPSLSLAWDLGHPEEALVASVTLGGLLLVLRGGGRNIVVGGVLMGLAAGGKQWALLLLPVALVATQSNRDAIRLVVSAGVAGVLITLPVIVAQFTAFTDVAAHTGGGGIFTRGNLWWWFGHPNPNYHEHQTGQAVQLFTTANSARFGPAWVENHAHQIIVLTALVLAGAWWWRIGRKLPRAEAHDAQAHAVAAPATDSSDEPGAARDPRHVRYAAVLFLAAAVLWWRAVGDPWFQAYYLLPALIAVTLAEVRLGRFPIAGLVAWCAIWLVHGQNAPDMGLSPDQTSLERQAWLLPFGVWLTIRALRPSR